jgi:hypothetical protein
MNYKQSCLENALVAMKKCLANISIAELFEQYFRGINASDE